MSQEENEQALEQLAKLVEAQGEVTRLTKELAEREASFELRWKADMRAIARWREESPVERDLLWPDHADLCVWLMRQLEAKDDLIKESLAALQLLPSRVGHQKIIDRLRADVAMQDQVRDAMKADGVNES